MTTEEERQKALARFSPARYATPGYEAVGLWLLRALAVSRKTNDYNAAVGKLWAACTSALTLPPPKAFEHDLAVARQKLDAAYASAANTAERHELERATAALNRAEEEATDAGLLA